MFKRAVVKLSGEQVGLGAAEGFYNDEVINAIVSQIKKAVDGGTQIAIVIGGGNIWRGRQASHDMNRVKADHIGMLATVINAIYLEESFRLMGARAKVVTPMPIGNFTSVYEKDNSLRHMDQGTVIISAAGLGHPMFSTDTVTALRAVELEADIVLFAKAVDGVYTADPKKSTGARKYRALSYSHGVERGLGIADIAALGMLQEAGIPSYVFRLDYPDSIRLACQFPNTGELKGTYLSIDGQEEFYGH